LPNVVITTGEAIRERMITYNRFNPQKIISIPTGVDLERFNPEKVRPVLKKEGFLIGMISVLRSWKGHKYLIEAAPKILSHISEAKFSNPTVAFTKSLNTNLATSDSPFKKKERASSKRAPANFESV